MRITTAYLALCAVASAGCNYDPVELPEDPAGDGDADVGEADLSDAVQLELTPYSQAAPRWNDYVLADDHEAPCPRTTPAADCVRAGVWRKVVVSGEESCAGLSAVDDRGWFDWTCSADRGEVVLTGRLRADVGLADVI